MDGTEGPRCQSVRAFARNLLRLRGPADRLLGRAALQRRGQPHADRRGRLSRARRAELVDKAAAAWILQGALDRLASL